METTDVSKMKKIQFADWYEEVIKMKLTYKSVIIPLSDLFVEVFLKGDGMFLPDKCDTSKLSESELQNYKTEVGLVTNQIVEALHQFKKGALVKLNWRSTQDAEFMTESLSAYTP